ncbi:MAG: DUF6075 family protein [Clostridia bacterium]|nr:DUF6075 family protein [Clostridia bacterium]
MKYFVDETHKNNVMKVIRDKRLVYPDGQVDCYYLPALFILLSTKNNLYKKTGNYITTDGIDFETIMEKQDFSSGEAKLVRLAANLYNGSMEVSPQELINTLDDRNYDLAMQAIRFSRYGCHIENLLDRQKDMEADIAIDVETEMDMENDFEMEL